MTAGSMAVAPAAEGAPERLPAVPSRKEDAVFPRWPWWPTIRWVRVGFLEGVMRPLLWLVLAPRIAPRVPLARPSLLIANHLTAFDVPVILYALTSNDRDHVAVAMSGQLLTGWRRGKAERHRLVSCLNSAGLLAGECAVQCVSLAPRRWIAAELRPRRGGYGSGLSRAGFSGRPPLAGWTVTAVRAGDWFAGTGVGGAGAADPGEGLKRLKGEKWPDRGTVAVRLGEPLTMEPGEEPQSFTRRLEAAVAALVQQAKG